MDLYILRHAIATELNTRGIQDDFDRPLTPEGTQKLKRVIKAMRHLELTFDLIVTSPYVRARETAEMVVAALPPRQPLDVRDSLGADGNLRELVVELSRVAPAPKSLLLVGHEPYLSTLITFLISGTTKSSLTLKKAGLCKMTVSKLRPGRCASLEWLLTPRQLWLIADSAAA